MFALRELIGNEKLMNILNKQQFAPETESFVTFSGMPLGGNDVSMLHYQSFIPVRG